MFDPNFLGHLEAHHCPLIRALGPYFLGGPLKLVHQATRSMGRVYLPLHVPLKINHLITYMRTIKNI